MPDIEEMVMAIRSLRELLEKLEKYQANKLIRGKILDSDEFINETRIRVQTSLQILEKRLSIHIEGQNPIPWDDSGVRVQL